MMVSVSAGNALRLQRLAKIRAVWHASTCAFSVGQASVASRRVGLSPTGPARCQSASLVRRRGAMPTAATDTRFPGCTRPARRTSGDAGRPVGAETGRSRGRGGARGMDGWGTWGRARTYSHGPTHTVTFLFFEKGYFLKVSHFLA
jgi:hypothetical protein